MTHARSTLLALLFALATPAAAQTTGGPGPTAPTRPTTPTDLDLPVDRPAAPAPPVDPVDPRDKPPPIIYGEEIPSESDTIFYVIDVSCSMDWDHASYVGLDGDLKVGPRIDRARCELTRSILGLPSNFSFNIVAFECGRALWSSGMREASAANKAAAAAWVAALRPLGGTGTGPATAVALAEKANLSVVLLTDGAPNCGAGDPWGWDVMDAHRDMIRDANTQRATITVFGIAASGEYRAFCNEVAADSGGSYFDVP